MDNLFELLHVRNCFILTVISVMFELEYTNSVIIVFKSST